MKKVLSKLGQLLLAGLFISFLISLCTSVYQERFDRVERVVMGYIPDADRVIISNVSPLGYATFEFVRGDSLCNGTWPRFRYQCAVN